MATMNIGSLVVDLIAESAQYIAGLQQLIRQPSNVRSGSAGRSVVLLKALPEWQRAIWGPVRLLTSSISR